MKRAKKSSAHTKAIKHTKHKIPKGDKPDPCKNRDKFDFWLWELVFAGAVQNIERSAMFWAPNFYIVPWLPVRHALAEITTIVTLPFYSLCQEISEAGEKA